MLDDAIVRSEVSSVYRNAPNCKGREIALGEIDKPNLAGWATVDHVLASCALQKGLRDFSHCTSGVRANQLRFLRHALGKDNYLAKLKLCLACLGEMALDRVVFGIKITYPLALTYSLEPRISRVIIFEAGIKVCILRTAIQVVVSDGGLVD